MPPAVMQGAIFFVFLSSILYPYFIPTTSIFLKRAMSDNRSNKVIALEHDWKGGK